MDPLEPYYEVASTCYRIGVTLFDACCFVLWVKPSFPERGKVSLWKIGAAYTAMMLFLLWVPFYIPKVLAYGLGAAAALIVMCAIHREKFGQKVFLAVTFFCMRWQSWSIEGNLSSWLFDRRTELMLQTRDMGFWSFIYRLAMESYEFWFFLFIVDCVMDFATGAVLLYSGVRLMRRAYGTGCEEIHGKELLLLTMPSILGVFAYGVVCFYTGAYENATGKSVYALPGQPILLPLYSLVSYFTILVTVYLFRSWKQEQEAEQQQRIFATQLNDMQSHITEVERLYADQRRLRHDMGNHLMTLERLYDSGAYEAAGKYAESLKHEIQDAVLEIGSGNPVTDAILSGRKKEMEEQGISFVCGFRYPQRGKADAFDISIILNNALDNAIEAVSQEQGMCREVTLSSRHVKNMYMIEVINPCAGELPEGGQNGLPPTAKKEAGHGYGLTNIRHVAQKYYGDMEIDVEEYAGGRRCVLRVMLQIPEE